MDCVARQNKLETPKEKDEVNKREVHECDVWTRDPDAMFFCLLLWIVEARAKDKKNFIWISVRWKAKNER